MALERPRYLCTCVFIRARMVLSPLLRLLLGRSHVVLCVNSLVGEVETVLKEAGCQGYSKLDEAHGLPDGWAGFRSVSPTNAITVETGISDPFYAVKPASDIEIEFEAGVRLRNSVWLAGYPPTIKLFGQPGAGIKALIDGKEAVPAEGGSLVVDGYGLPGSHSVYCGGVSRSYSVEEPPDSWEAWPAYQFGEAKICGALVQLPAEDAGRPSFHCSNVEPASHRSRAGSNLPLFGQDRCPMERVRAV